MARDQYRYESEERRLDLGCRFILITTGKKIVNVIRVVWLIDRVMRI